MNPNIGEHAAAGGHEKENRRQAARDARTVTMPPLDSVTNAQARLAIINDLAVNGLLAGSQAGAAVRAVEVWLKAHALDLDLTRLRDLEKTITHLEAELKKARLRVS